MPSAIVIAMHKLLRALLPMLLLAGPATAERLSGATVPEHYTLWFAPNLQNATFRGRATIRVHLSAASTTVTLHATELAFTQVRITAGARTQTARVSTDAASETATFTVDRPVPAGTASIDIAYTGSLNDKLRGFYLSTANGRKYAISQMEATDARRAFPSFDEPAYKATFDISLTIDAGDTAISNGRQIADAPGPEPNTHTVTFATTPRMSSYLVALLVGDFTCRTGQADGTVVRVCATPDKLPLTRFALSAAEQQLAFYNRYFGLTYPFGKLDIVAVPDFAAGAMENAGAITFRERLLLVEPERASVSSLKNVASTISHEIAHQWFGELVTMRWWDDIWLNEGFATWAASKPLAEWKPLWRVDLDDAADTQGALAIDALRTTRAIRMRVDTPDQINEVFDGIAYEKTAGVLRMIEAYVGPEPFRNAIRSYLRKHAFGNATGEDFWTELARVTGRPVDRVLKGFVDQPGAPVVSVRTRCVQGATDLTLTQERFVGGPRPAAVVPAATPTATPTAATASASSPLWTLPVCFHGGTGPLRCEVLDTRQTTIHTAGCGPVFVNAGSRGYYFSEYEPDAVRALAGPAAGLTTIEKISLLGDEWRMIRAGRHDVGSYLDVASGLAGDETPAVIDDIAGRIGVVATDIADQAERAPLQRWIRARFGPTLAALGLPGPAADTDDRLGRRATLLSLVGQTGNDPAVQAQARELARLYLDSPTTSPSASAAALSPTLAGTVLRVAASSGDQTLYDEYLARIQKPGEPEEYYRFLSALPSFRDPALVKRTLDFALSPAVRSQDTPTLVAGLLGSTWGRDLAWDFSRNRWAELTAKLGTFQGVPSVVGALGGFCSLERRDQIRAFFTEHPVPSAARALAQAIERIDACVDLDARQSPAFARWLGTVATGVADGVVGPVVGPVAGAVASTAAAN